MSITDSAVPPENVPAGHLVQAPMVVDPVALL